MPSNDQPEREEESDGGVDPAVALVSVTIIVVTVAIGAFVGTGGSMPDIIAIALALVASFWMIALRIGCASNASS